MEGGGELSGGRMKTEGTRGRSSKRQAAPSLFPIGGMSYRGGNGESGKHELGERGESGDGGETRWTLSTARSAF